MTIPANAPEPIVAGAAAPARSKSLRGRLADLWPRIVSSLLLATVAILSWLSGGAVFVAAWLAACLVVEFEWQQLVGGLRQLMRFVAAALALIAAAILANASSSGFALAVLALGGFATAALAEPGRRLWSGAGVVYSGSLFVALSALRLSFPFGSHAIGWLFAVVWSTDVVAYFAGRLIGGPKLLPQISPAKTWVGTICGMLGGAGFGLLFLLVWAQVTRLEPLAPMTVLFLLGLATSAVAQAGDLFESWMKRRFGAKDSGNLIPGHGGLLDRLDGFIAAAVFVTILGAVRGFPSPAEGLFHWF